ncbi:MAG: succinate dehydrogenase [Peptococcaceae bacterium BICA1-8]|nr:MAG: succinate dehydrogenase [Peptococcaceae bacterium BICA1-8]
MQTIQVKVKRQNGPKEQPFWEEFTIPYKSNLNVISLLMYIAKNPVNSKGEKTTPVVYESNCLEEVCGACSMVINGKARQACTALVDTLAKPITLEPLDKFQLVRDLFVDRTALFDALRKVKAWVDIDGTFNLGPGPKTTPKVQEKRYDLSRCMTCGVCSQVCPNYNTKTSFIGPHAVAQADLFNLHSVGGNNKEERFKALMDKGGIMECGNSQNCVRACPKEIPLTQSLAELKRQATWYSIKSLFTK